ncbi:MAG TPA: cell division protein FtsA [Firmicutes bacterium]|nr:cell division protein FtsA [Bacillota bacterium]
MPGREIMAGLDIGTTKTAVVIIESGQTGDAEIIGIGVAPSKGVKKGIVVELASAAQAISEAVELAERMSGVDIEGVYVGVPSLHVTCQDSHGMIAITHDNHEISSRDVERVLHAAKLSLVPPDREILHILPSEYIIDGCRGIREPVGMKGTRLEVEVQIITGMLTMAQNIQKSVELAGLEVYGKVLQIMATGEAILDPEEKDAGVIILDIGGGATHVAVLGDGRLLHQSVIPAGGQNITSDLAVGLRIPLADAERLKREYRRAQEEIASARQRIIDSSLVVNEPDHGRNDFIPKGRGRQQPAGKGEMLSYIIEARLRELVEMAEQQVHSFIVRGMVPCGVLAVGGVVNTPGALELIQEVFHLPVRLGTPRNVIGFSDLASDPSLAGGIGVAKYGARMHAGNNTGPLARARAGNIFDQFLDWLKELF